ncbi:hypothetical protein [Treponema bryantii]|jgi:hypothetical protein|uniref:hypothetical protein n=1 Tax=Treponema bryantii TaxID=163 RepID=UPI0003B4B64E|nr:hypothetical protein [Treponema bryantii]
MKVNSVNKSIILILIILCLTSFFASCKKKTAEVIVFDDSHPLALAPDVEWAVVTEPYAVFKESDEWGAATAGHCRKGEILQVKGKSVDADKENWYYFEGGWLPQSCVSIFSNRYKAETISKGLLSSEN